MAAATYLFSFFELASAKLPEAQRGSSFAAGSPGKRTRGNALRQFTARLATALNAAVQARRAGLALGEASGSGRIPELRPVVDRALRAIRVSGSKTPLRLAGRGSQHSGRRNEDAEELSAPGGSASRSITAESPDVDKAAEVTGRVEGLVGFWLVGWALNLAHLRPCTILIIDESGTGLVHQPS